jgi:hypothetical protein
VFSLWSVHGLNSRAATGTAVSELVSNGKGRHKCWLQQLEPGSSEILRVELVTSEYSGRAAAFREELQLQ